MNVAAPKRFSTSRRATCTTLAPRMLRILPKSVSWALVIGTASLVHAAPDERPAVAPQVQESAEQPTALESSAAQAAQMDKPLRGISMQAHVGGGYMVLDQKIPANTQFPQLGGRNELLGAGPAVAATLGVDLLEWLSLELTGGMTLSGARRADYVHSLSQGYGAIGARFGLAFWDRWKLNLTPAIAYYHQDNEVDVASSGVGLMGQVGVEYYAHVRHFSVGADLAVQAPLTPTRVFIGVMPHVRYTF